MAVVRHLPQLPVANSIVGAVIHGALMEGPLSSFNAALTCTEHLRLQLRPSHVTQGEPNPVQQGTIRRDHIRHVAEQVQVDQLHHSKKTDLHSALNSQRHG